jgi:hypothetical protein
MPTRGSFKSKAYRSVGKHFSFKQNKKKEVSGAEMYRIKSIFSRSADGIIAVQLQDMTSSKACVKFE